MRCPYCSNIITITPAQAAKIVGAAGGSAKSQAQKAWRAQPKLRAGRPTRADLNVYSLLPIDTGGIDFRATGSTILLAESGAYVYLDSAGRTRRVSGSRRRVRAALRLAGYTTT